MMTEKNHVLTIVLRRLVFGHLPFDTPPLPPVKRYTRSSATAEIARVGGRYAVQGHSRSLMFVLGLRKLTIN